MQTTRPPTQQAPEGPAIDPFSRVPDRLAEPTPPSLPDARPGAWEELKDACSHRSLLRPLGRRFLLKVIQGTKLDWAWLIIRPLMASLGMTLLFGAVLRTPTPEGVPYFLFLLAGLISWDLFERSILFGTRSFSINRKVMKTHRFPLLLVPLAAMSYSLVTVAVYALVFAGALVFFWAIDGHMWLQVSWQTLLIVPGGVLLVAFTVGGLLWGSVLNAKARDVRYTLRYVLPIWMYVTPVVYPASQLPENLRWVAVVNPLSAPVALVKEGLLGVGQVSTSAIACSLGMTAALLLSGLWYFNREAARCIDGAVGPEEDDDV